MSKIEDLRPIGTIFKVVEPPPKWSTQGIVTYTWKVIKHVQLKKDKNDYGEEITCIKTEDFEGDLIVTFEKVEDGYCGQCGCNQIIHYPQVIELQNEIDWKRLNTEGEPL